ncbi:NADP-dependent 3-hydroxy acid dehydrogenase YdfG [Litorivivens lipolytica]|uniref:NADP-dependent 3-hydroxy acid dehydrogenase YdfG n=1 Tax=Litorivivens lipolytica TaxID=1524264 RepID=A0A7W4Z5P0_9GAMM|nr:SDR family oxidoreductase [Litorivivens lipolytica]MBB3046186.1 NADP-dependent 3-hydroxy acid dehydrogenase YdfG [Litorivivens lipolytica]
MKTIIITGAASGIGRATSELLAREGWHIGLLDINREALDNLQKDLGTDKCSVHVCNVTQSDELKGAIDAYVASVGHLDAIFNCAGIMDISPFEQIPLERHHLAIDINIRGVLDGFYFAFEHLKKREKSWAVTMSSASSVYGIPSLANYSATKFWVKGMTEALNIEWKQHGIHVTAVEPSFVRTPLLHGNESKIIDSMGVDLKAEDIAQVVLKSLNSSRIHHVVGFKYGTMRFLRKILPNALAAWLISALAGY